MAKVDVAAKKKELLREDGGCAGANVPSWTFGAQGFFLASTNNRRDREVQVLGIHDRTQKGRS